MPQDTRRLGSKVNSSELLTLKYLRVDVIISPTGLILYQMGILPQCPNSRSQSGRALKSYELGSVLVFVVPKSVPSIAAVLLSLFLLDFHLGSFDRFKADPKWWPLPEGAKLEVLVKGQPLLTWYRLEIKVPDHFCDE